MSDINTSEPLSISKLKHIGRKGSGYFCDVVKYQHEETGSPYALKMLKKKFYTNEGYRYRLLREVKLQMALSDCDHVVDVLISGNDKENERLWYLMPFANCNLYDYISKHNNTLTDEDRFTIFDQIVSAIKCAHSKGIIHRDISPNNVLIFERETGPMVQVSDFGLGKDENSLSHYTGSSASGYGQILYVSPEQLAKLKDATPKSDIYGLGKLAYFVFTGKSPSNFQPFMLSSLVSRATEEYPENRFENIQEFEEHYEALKDLHSNQSIPVDYLTLKDIVTTTEDIEWVKFHESAVLGTWHEHPYYDYLDPIISFLSKGERIKEYYNSIGADFHRFAQTYADRIDNCFGTTGWPFNQTGTFGRFLRDIIITVDDPNTRLICFKAMWTLAYVADQWDVQKYIKEVLNEDFIDSSIQFQLAGFIKDEAIELDMAQFSNLKLPAVIKVSIIQSNELYKKKEQERLKKQNENPSDWNF